jgi:serine/threonine protein phosphatase PrpC
LLTWGLWQGMTLDYAVRSDAGRVRENNEDSICLAPELNLFVLSDGMGGQACGEVASRLATETIVAKCRDGHGGAGVSVDGERVEGASDTVNRLADAVRAANLAVYQESQKSMELQGMGATVVAVWLTAGRITVAHVGDSRAYRLRDGQFEQLTEDHSFVAEQVRRGAMTEQEAGTSKLQNVLTRALGVDESVPVDVDEQILLEGDTILLCSDGLTRELSDAQIAAVLGEADVAQQAVDKLVDLANQAGGEDNITAVVVRNAPKGGGPLTRMGRWFKGSEDRS